MIDQEMRLDRAISRKGDLTTETQARLRFGRGVVEINQYVWSQPTSDIWTSDSYFLHLCLTPRPGPAQATYLDAKRPIHESVGRVIFVPSARTVRTTTCSGNLRSLVCSLSPPILEDLLPRPPQWNDTALAEGLHLNSPQIESILLQMYRELHQPGFASEVLMESLAAAAAVALIRKFRLHQKKEDNATSGGLPGWRMNRIRDRIHADIAAPRLSELAELCNMSIRHLSRSFKEETGMTVATYVEHATVKRACKLLGESDYALEEIAKRLGFNSLSGFSVAFRRSIGSTPSAFRREFSNSLRIAGSA